VKPSTAPSQFAASWPAIQTALERGELARGHHLLSQWFGDRSLSPAEAERVETLLSQLAGTVIYSNEHRLEPPRSVRAGETLELIAKEYGVPWQLLAKINSIPASDQVRPGQELKVVRGPFHAAVDLSRKQVVLQVDGRYAGKFSVFETSAAAADEGEWVVVQKTASPAQSAYQRTASGTDRILNLARMQVDPMTTQITIGSGGSAAGAVPSRPTIVVAPRDAEELSDILSIGSRVVIRR
jgi:LysM repeat protein